MKNNSITILSGAATGNLTGAAFPVQQIVSMSVVSATADATVAGTLKLQCSNDNPNPTGKGIGGGTPFVPTNWADIPNATSTITAGAGPAIVVPNMCFQYIRAVFTRTGGTSTFNVIASQLSV